VFATELAIAARSVEPCKLTLQLMSDEVFGLAADEELTSK